MSLERDIHKETEELQDAVHQLYFIRKILERAFTPQPVQFNVFQIYKSGGFMNAGKITGVAVGSSTATFGETDPAGFTDPTGTTRAWTSSDTTNTTLTPSTDAAHASVGVAASASAPVGGSFILTYTDTNAAGVVIGTSGPITVPYLPAVTSAPVDFVVNQLTS